MEDMPVLISEKIAEARSARTPNICSG